MEFQYVVAPLPSWQHRDSFVVGAFATQFCYSLGTAVTPLYVLEPPTQV